MKNYISILMLICFASFSQAQDNFDNQWKKVAKLESKGLTKSAAELVNTIYNNATDSKNKEQQIKALLHKSKYMLILEEEAQLQIVNLFQAEIETAKNIPTKHLLENMLATLYWQYFQQNRWKFYNRSKTDVKIDDDFRTWDLETLFTEIHTYFQKSLQNGLLLQQEPLENYSLLLNEAKDSKLYRPTLYDLLAHNALRFYKTTETSITQPAYKFTVNKPEYLGQIENFINVDISSKDSVSLQLNALKIYQNLLKFHRSKKASKALVAADIERLNFVKQQSTLNNTDSLFLDTLEKSATKISNQQTSGLYHIEKAHLFVDQGAKYDANSPAKTSTKNTRWKLKEADSICQSIITTFPDSEAAKKAATLKQHIEYPQLDLRIEEFLPVGKPSRILVNYKNINQLYFEAFKLSYSQLKELNKLYQAQEKFNYLNRLQPHTSWSNNIKNEQDYQKHSTEVIVPELENGFYIIRAKTDASDSVFALAQLQVTDIAIVETNKNEKVIYQIINRNNGQPITNAHIELSYDLNKPNKTKRRHFVSDKSGHFVFKKHDRYLSNITIDVKYQKQFARFGNWYINRSYSDKNRDKETYNAFVFTDRSIYRPSQTLYFKGIITKTFKNNTEVASDETVVASCHNVNGEKLSELSFKTNDYGSYHGEFVLPNDGLTGQFFIETQIKGRLSERNYFSVEEYKRPKFKPEFQPITETFKVNDSITVKGKAVAFAGSNISNAKVVYRVKRQVQYPNWWYWERPNYYSSEAQEITFGESKTNEKGDFEITFKALPDESVSKDNLPVFRYEVTADVTDINGETRSTVTVVNVGYHSVLANLNMPTRIDKTSKNTAIKITTTNLNGEAISAKGIFKLYKLKAPETVYRKRPWNAPDYKTIPKAQFQKLFPHDAYANEDNLRNWEIGNLVFETSFNTKDTTKLTLKPSKKWESGTYIGVIETKDKFGQLVKDKTYTTLFSPKDKTIPDSKLFNISLDKEQYNIGNTAVLSFGSAAKDVTVTITIEKNKKHANTNIYKLNNSKKQIKLPINKDDVGGFIVHYSLAAFNSYVSGQIQVNVPYPKTDLQIETTTFRDKLEPGQDETWSFKIKGPKGDKVAAEVLASMYDASLDEFRWHNWQFNPINRPMYFGRLSKNARQSFGTTNFRRYNQFEKPSFYAQQSYDQLNWFGFSFGKAKFLRRQHLLRQTAKPSYYTSSIKTEIKSGFIEGTVYAASDNLPLPGVSIMKKGTTTGVQSDLDGKFKIKAKAGDKIVVNYVSMLSIEININKDNFYNIYLEDDIAALEEVVVIANITQEKKSRSAVSMLSEEMSSVQSDESVISNRPVPAASQTPAEQVAGVDTENSKNPDENLDSKSIQIRKNLNETAFFFPQLQTDVDGNVSFNFKAPEALTQWKLQLLAHTKTLESSVKQLETVTQKELMVIPNTPRFLREGDQITISTKIANLTEKQLSGVAQLILTNPITGKDISNEIVRLSSSTTLSTSSVETSSIEQNFNVKEKSNVQVSWKLNIPKGLQVVQYQIIAKAGNFSDGEQNALPVLTNRMLVTETLPMWVGSNETKTFTLDKLASTSLSDPNNTLSHHKLTLEITSNPAWYAVQALPYLMEYPYDCNEQTFSRYYANALAQHIVKSNPKIEAVFNQWATSTSLSNQKDALLSNLEKNQELKSLLIQETPWLRDAQSESEQKKRIGLLFDFNKMTNELNSALRKLKQNQLPSGAWPWFNGGYANRFITQHIMSGFGHLRQLNVIPTERSDEESQMIKNAIQYLDTEFVKEYKDIRKYNKDVDLSKDHLSYTQLHYMYVRSFFPGVKASKEVQAIMDYYKSQIQTYWLKRSLYAKGLMALTMHRMNDDGTAGKILKSLKENSITSDELGMYWKSNTSSWYWHQAPIESQSLLIEAFSEVGTVIQSKTKNLEDIDNLKIWLLKNKQTNRWETTKATTEAVYALLLQGSSWLDTTEMTNVKVGNDTINPLTLDNVKVEAGTGYYKTSWTGKEIKPEQAKVTISKKGNGIAWGALYWQYFEDLDKISSTNSVGTKTPLKLSKKLFLKRNTDKGEELSEITKDTQLNVGDLVSVRIELRSDRDMEFVHLKDMRAAGFEPINVLSQYKWQDGLGYHESTKDAATNFFIDYLPKGVYVFEYDLRVNNAGEMSNGISTIQCMYAPEFSSHSEGIRIKVE